MKEPEELPKLTIDNGYVLCPDCKTRINVGKVGIQNYYKRHKGSAQCAANKRKKRIEDTTEKTKQNASRFFRPRAPAVLPTVKAPTPVQPHTYPLNPSTAPTPPLQGCSSHHPPPVLCLSSYLGVACLLYLYSVFICTTGPLIAPSGTLSAVAAISMFSSYVSFCSHSTYLPIWIDVPTPRESQSLRLTLTPSYCTPHACVISPLTYSFSSVDYCTLYCTSLSRFLSCLVIYLFSYNSIFL
jgi:hypothetical protein